MELGIYTFAESAPDPMTGQAISPAERLRNLIEESLQVKARSVTLGMAQRAAAGRQEQLAIGGGDLVVINRHLRAASASISGSACRPSGSIRCGRAGTP